jgi:DNA invertase Pin-like site-specific DNA recombinase
MQNFIPYYRVSSKRQGVGSSIERQKKAVHNYIATISDAQIIAEFTEFKPATKNEKQTELHTALKLAAEKNATIIVSELDVKFIFHLHESKTPFLAVDMPNPNTATLGMFAAWAQFESERKSIILKDALARRKETKGEWRIGYMTPEIRAKGQEAIKKKKRDDPTLHRAREYATLLRNEKMTFEKISTKLNENGFTTQNGKPFKKEYVIMLLKPF